MLEKNIAFGISEPWHGESTPSDVGRPCSAHAQIAAGCSAATTGIDVTDAVA